MVTMIQNWRGAVEVNGTVYENIEAASTAFKAFSDTWNIKLLPKGKGSHVGQDSHVLKAKKDSVAPEEEHEEFRITVKAYMTRPTEAGSTFDFMAKWNHNIPMPLRTMVGYTVKETKGMKYMKLHGKGLAEVRCMRCGRTLTHPISRKYGIGPECIQKLGFSYGVEDVEEITDALTDVKWEGWVIKSAILEEEEV